MIARVVLACVVGCVACGDNLEPPDDLFAPASGSRLRLEWYRYDDGTEQAEPNQFFDAQESTSCRPQRWIDDVVRCVPVADDAVYIDAACVDAVGRGTVIAHPTHFIGYDRTGETLRPARLYRAGGEIAPVLELFEKQDGVCVGPFTNPELLTYYELTGEVDGSSLVQVADGELGEGRLGFRVRESDDGLRAPFGLRDRDLDVECTPAPRSDGGPAIPCEPSGSVLASHFRDPACREPVVVVAEDAPPPAIASITSEPSGCASYHAVGGEVSGSLYRRNGDACIPAVIAAGQRVFTVDAPIVLATLSRTLEDVDRRLQRIVLGDGGLRFADDVLFDTATRAVCRRQAFEDVTRCIPASVATATTLFTTGCAVEVRVAELPERTCERLAFATAPTAEGEDIDIHAIGDPVSGPLFHVAGGSCRPYPGTPGTVLRLLGPRLDPRAFVGALYFGER